MGFSMRIFPGVRVGVTRRGFNASVGPRIARVHAGPGGMRYSSGIGPFSVSGGGRRRRYSSSGGGLDLEAFNEAMTVSSETREIRLQEQIDRHLKSGWKLISKGSFDAELQRVGKPARSLFKFLASALFFYALLNGGLIPFLEGRFDMRYWWGLLLNLAVTALAGVNLWFQGAEFFGSKKGDIKKLKSRGRKRRIEVSTWGLVHKHYYG